MGNQLLKTYNVDQSSAIGGGPYLRWTIYEGRGRGGEQCSLFVMEKRELEKIPRRERESIEHNLRGDISGLLKLVHPALVRVTEAPPPHDKFLHFATPPIKATLALFLKQQELSFLEIRCGVWDICEGLQFLHEEAELMHRGLSPHSIFVCLNGTWKLGGMGYSTALNSPPPPFRYASSTHLSLDPPVQYAAPEQINQHQSVGACSDMFALGLILFELMSGRRFSDAFDFEPETHLRSLTSSSFRFSDKSRAIYENPCLADFSSELSVLVGEIENLLQLNPAERPSISQFLNGPFFCAPSVRTLRFLDKIAEKDDKAKEQFFLNFNRLIITDISFHNSQLIKSRIFPRILPELSKPALLPAVLPLFFSLLEKVQESLFFQSRLLKLFLPILVSSEITVDLVLLIIRNLPLLLSLTSEESVVRNDYIPFLVKCTNLRDTYPIQIAILRSLPLLAKSLPFDLLLHKFIPHVISLAFDPSLRRFQAKPAKSENQNIPINGANIGINGANMGVNAPDMGVNMPNMGVNIPNMGIHPPVMGINPPNMSVNTPNMGVNITNMGVNIPNMGVNTPNMGDKLAQSHERIGQSDSAVELAFEGLRALVDLLDWKAILDHFLPEFQKQLSSVVQAASPNRRSTKQKGGNPTPPQLDEVIKQSVLVLKAIAQKLRPEEAVPTIGNLLLPIIAAEKISPPTFILSTEVLDSLLASLKNSKNKQFKLSAETNSDLSYVFQPSPPPNIPPPNSPPPHNGFDEIEALFKTESTNDIVSPFQNGSKIPTNQQNIQFIPQKIQSNPQNIQFNQQNSNDYLQTKSKLQITLSNSNRLQTSISPNTYGQKFLAGNAVSASAPDDPFADLVKKPFGSVAAFDMFDMSNTRTGGNNGNTSINNPKNPINNPKNQINIPNNQLNNSDINHLDRIFNTDNQNHSQSPDSDPFSGLF